MTSASVITNGDIVRMIGTLLGIIAIILISAFLLKRMKLVNFNKNNDLKILAGLSLGSKERVILIEAGDKQILIGVTNQTITPIHVFEDPVVESEIESGQSSFLQILQNKVKRGVS
jgi:flagellar protein FliO/FliZ